ncbi:MAG TPA: protein-glutamate O-methyltransferase CheR [Polyangiaceae bacterium]|nr:protein-glutamate O-methyltransferase CheR [Polyangiaceae bacterium]
MSLASRPDDIRLRPDEFRMLRDLVNGHAGIYFGDEALPVLERRLRERLLALGLKKYSEYYQFLQFASGGVTELDEAIDLLTTNETYFFREDYQLRAFGNEVLPRLADDAASRRRLSVWSAGCSTGEEVYTLAILIKESGLFPNWDIRVYGSDISRRCVAAARRGIYGPSAFRTSPAAFRRDYFIERADGSHVIDPIRELCHFGHLNLMDNERVRVVGRVDAVFCRNVLIYFDQKSRKKVIDMFYERLIPGGYLFLGHSESLLNISTAFELVHLSEDLIYRKPLAPVAARGGYE